MKIRKAKIEDLPQIISLLADDDLGKLRETSSLNVEENYVSAFNTIISDPNQELLVAEEAATIIATLQLSFIQYLTYRGGLRAQIEAVRVKKNKRGTGLGRTLLAEAIERAKKRGAHLVQLTTDKQRPDALMFYESLGFTSSHQGMKLHLLG